MPNKIVMIEIWGVCSSFTYLESLITKLNRIINKSIIFSLRDEATRISREELFKEFGISTPKSRDGILNRGSPFAS